MAGLQSMNAVMGQNAILPLLSAPERAANPPILNQPTPSAAYLSHHPTKSTATFAPDPFSRPPTINHPQTGGLELLGFGTMNINAPTAGWNIPGIRRKHHISGRPESITSNRIPFLSWVPRTARNHFVASAGEFVGTFLFLFFALSGTQVANTQPTDKSTTTVYASNPALLLYISLCFGFSLAVNAWVFFRISGGLFNPAVTFGMCLVGALPWWRGLWLFFAQVLGGLSSAAVVSVLFPGELNSRTTLAGGTTVSQGLFIEMFCTAELVFTIFMLAAEKHKGTFIAPIGIGLSLFVAELTAVYYTGGSLNPARSLGPAVATRTFANYHWIYWVGPFLGTLLAAGFYKFIKVLEYETANPGQDSDDHDAKAFNPDKVDEEQPRTMDYATGPAMQPANAQFDGLASGGMHANERDPRAAGDVASPAEKSVNGLPTAQHHNTSNA